jgi:hypothetical protein
MENTMQDRLNNAQKAESEGEFFKASFFYRDALEEAIKKNDSGTIKLCKNKSVEMNRKSIASGKDFKEISITQEFPEDKVKAHDEFIKKFLEQEDLKTILSIMGKHPHFYPHAEDVKKTSQKTIPITYQIASLTNISDEGYNLRGSSNGEYAWFIKMYGIRQQLAMLLYVGRVIHELMEKFNPLNAILKM